MLRQAKPCLLHRLESLSTNSYGEEVNNSVEPTVSTPSGAAQTAARTVALVAAAFSLVVALLLGVNAIQSRRANPLRSAGMEQLLAELKVSPDSVALRDEVRAFDLLARQAFFSSQRFARRGAYVLLGSVLLLLVALHVGVGGDAQVAAPGQRKDTGDAQRQARLMIGGVGGILVIAAFFLAYGNVPAKQPITESGKQAAGPRAAPRFPSRAEVLQNWPCFRGPDGLGIAHCSKAPIAWNGASGKGIAWSLPLEHSGFGAPVIWGSHLFLSVADDNMLGVMCIDTGGGKVLWKKAVVRVAGAPEEWPEVTDDTGYAAPSMATDGQRAFAIYATGDIVCFSVTGEQLWTRHLGTPENHYGHSSSLILYRDRLIVQYDEFKKPRLLALDSHTGVTIWETVRPVEISWASPALIHGDGDAQIVLNASPVVAAYSAMTGASLWSVECMGGEVAPSIAFADGIVFAANEYATCAAVDVKTKAIKWQNDEINLPDVASPVAARGFVFLASSSGVITCMEGATGTLVWKHEFAEGFYSSPIVVADRVYVTDMVGVTHIFRAGPAYETLGTCELGEAVVSTPGVVNGRIYLRGVETLFCIGE